MIKVGWQIVAESRQNFYLYPHNHWGYWTKIHQIFAGCRGIAINARIHVAILQFVVERQSKEWRWSISSSAKGPKN